MTPGLALPELLRSRGCVSPKDFQQLLEEILTQERDRERENCPQHPLLNSSVGVDGHHPPLFQLSGHLDTCSEPWQLEQEVGRRRRLGQESAARKALIASSYHPARPDLYSSLQDAALAPEFVAAAKYSASPGAHLEGLLQLLETVSEEKRIYRVPVFSLEFCRALLEELEHFEQSDMPKGRPNTMNNHGVLMHELGLDGPLVTPLRERFLQPLMALLYPDCGGGHLDSHRAFVVKYALGQDLELGCHYDNAELTLNVALGKAFTGGALYFGALFQAPAALKDPLEVDHVVGQGILHRGGQLHGARPLGTGERWNLVVWLRASTVRNHLCPMCRQKPDLVDDEGFSDGFTREEPPTVDVCALT
ncbi:2-oxoglutarate and iron-dependent oxygenase domain-containing protein 2 isoform X2 [Meriones unguiculatus]|uniref:2-oxoglutarate and iron-dependent oxygenase domain-containing protein 2 isoform X2 n=1 Tax=Meriones unguiculatus TaxID=10047 RepID=UPI00293E1133|nr:2-oxoglutarate and iron-dependent oxygenase domain-containing protein 2 isoform X2 [Meriones unguiculatus]